MYMSCSSTVLAALLSLIAQAKKKKKEQLVAWHINACACVCVHGHVLHTCFIHSQRPPVLVRACACLRATPSACQCRPPAAPKSARPPPAKSENEKSENEEEYLTLLYALAASRAASQRRAHAPLKSLDSKVAKEICARKYLLVNR